MRKNREVKKHMDNFKAIFQILKYIESNMDLPEFDEAHFTAARFGLSETRFFKLLQALVAAGYISGVHCERLMGGFTDITLVFPSLTLQGMEYLEGNTMMKKAYKALKGIKEITPGL